MKFLNRSVWILSLVSLFADIASEMLYPVIPVYLREVGFSVLLIGILEGIAEFTAGFTKGYFGKKSDETGLRLPFIKSGYFLSAISKPMMAILTWPVWIFFARTTDRLGKGLRTAARDALLSSSTTRENKAKVFGFHRGMDSLGAVIGPLTALLFLTFFPGHYRELFYFALLPGLIAVALIFLLREKRNPASGIQRKGFFSFFSYWKIAPPAFKKLVAPLFLFALVNSSDVFLLLKTKEITGSDSTTITYYIVYNLVFALSAYPAGWCADRFGMRKVFALGLLFFVIVYTSFAFDISASMLLPLFVLYGLYAAATEGIAKAWITNLSGEKNTATAIGFYTSGQSISSLLASIIAGGLWASGGSGLTFLTTAVVSFAVFLYFAGFRQQPANLAQ